MTSRVAASPEHLPHRPDDDRIDLKSLLPDELRTFTMKLGKERYRGNQLLRWVHGRGVYDFGEMTDLAKGLREELPEVARVEHLEEVARAVSGDEQTTKLLFRLRDGRHIETVLMREGKRRTVCLSTQVGCALGCDLCATGQLGLIRNLTVGEIIDQLIQTREVLRERLLAEGKPDEAECPITNVVLMGMGEPLHNYEAVVKAVKLMGLDMGLAISATRVTISTAGLVPMIERLAKDLPKVGLAISLNATTDAVRDELMPINCRYPIRELMGAAAHVAKNSRKHRVTFEYVLIAGVNDSDEDARRLASLVSSFPCRVNLIPFNPIPDSSYERPARERVDRFHRILWDKDLTVTVRWSKGDDIAAACGQLQAIAPT